MSMHYRITPERGWGEVMSHCASVKMDVMAAYRLHDQDHMCRHALWLSSTLKAPYQGV